ncbi:MAG: hypothetical protein K6F65_01940 [Lachnospiraceae bacterium]|nr:hypothetical protein [Lachnospiraceae bacterium]
MADIREKKETKERTTGIEFNYFRIFMLLWILMLLLVVWDFNRQFYSFLENTEAKYRASLPESVTEEIVNIFRDGDVNYICELMTGRCPLNGYETDKDLREYMRTLIGNGRISTVPVQEETSDDRQVYYIESGDLRVARAEYSKEPERTRRDIPVWDLVSLEVYAEPAISIGISAPENVRLFINGKELSAGAVRVKQDPSPAQKYYEGFTTLPVMTDVNIGGFYLTPEITAKNEDGSPIPVIADPENGVYSVGYPEDCEGREEMESIACEAVSAYAEFISGDLAEGALRRYFTKDNIYLYYMQHAELKWFTRHLKSEIHSADVQEFIAYNEDAFYCEVLVEQHLTMQWGPREPEVIMTDGKFYFVRQDGEWKVAAIAF